MIEPVLGPGSFVPPTLSSLSNPKQSNGIILDFSFQKSKKGSNV